MEKSKEYHQNGKVSFEGSYKDGKRHGPCKSYSKKGDLKSRGVYQEGKKHGPFTEYNKKGRLVYDGYYRLDQRYKGEWKDNVGAHGRGKLFNDDDSILFEGEFRDDKKCGTGKAYYQTGELRFEGQFIDDRRSGTGKVYYQSGKLAYDGDWKDGKKHGKGKAPGAPYHGLRSKIAVVHLFFSPKYPTTSRKCTIGYNKSQKDRDTCGTITISR